MKLVKDIYRVFFIEKRLPYSWQTFYQNMRYKNKLNVILAEVLKTKPISCSSSSDTELHMLTCKNDTNMAILSLKSLLRFEDNFSVVVHGDKTLTETDLYLFKKHIPNCRTVSYLEARELAKSNNRIDKLRSLLPEMFKLGSEYNTQRDAWALKVFDFHLTSNSQKVFVLDSDTLFLQKPERLTDWINSGQDSFYAVPYTPNLRIPESIYLEKFPNSELIESFNGGFFGFHREIISMDAVADVVEKIKDNSDVLIYGDECIWRLVIGTSNSSQLPYEHYPLFATKKRYDQLFANSSQFRYIHFLLKHRGGVYSRVAEQVLLDL